MTVSTAFPQSRVARGVAIKTAHENLGASGTKYRPVRVAIFGQGAVAKEPYSTTKQQVLTTISAAS